MGNACWKFIILPKKTSRTLLPSLISYKRNNTLPRNYLATPTKSLDIELPEFKSPSIEPIQQEPSNKSSHYRKSAIIANYIVIWFTSNIDDDQMCITHLQRIVSSFRVFTDIDEFFAFIIQIRGEKIFLILSDTIAQKIIPLIHKMSQLISIYIICKDRLEDEQWIEQYRKIIGIFTHIEPICERLKRKIHLSKNDIIPIEIIDSSSMIIKYLIKHILLYETDYHEKSKTDLIDFARKEYPDELNIINEFEQNYTPSTSVWWYTRKCFLYSIMSQAFQTQNIEILIKMGFFIRDLHEQIGRLYSETDKRNPMIVYRGQGILENELEIIKTTKNGVLSFNDFLWANTDREISLSYAHLARNNPDLFGVLFRMEINSLIPFISLEKRCYDLNASTDILFSIYSTFRIGDIKQIEDKIWEIDLILINDNDQEIKDFLRPIEEEIEGTTAWEQLGSYFIQINQFDKAEELYKVLVESKSINDPRQLAVLNEQLGFIFNKKDDSINSLSYYRQSLKNYLTFSSSDDSRLLPIYLDIAILLREQNKSNGAIKHFKQALNVALHSSKPDYLQIAILYHHIAEIYDKDGIFIEAIQNYQSALENELNHFPLHNLSIAKTYDKIGELFYRMKEYTTALSYYDKTLKIQKKALSPNHSELTVTNYNIATVLDGLQQYKEAIEYAARAVNIARHTFGSDHQDVRLYEDYLNELRQKTLIGVIPNGAVYE
jgi:tetratricopeptide (TPR) repeat protein